MQSHQMQAPELFALHLSNKYLGFFNLLPICASFTQHLSEHVATPAGLYPMSFYNYC